jgi:hypothetical protein
MKLLNNFLFKISNNLSDTGMNKLGMNRKDYLLLQSYVSRTFRHTYSIYSSVKPIPCSLVAIRSPVIFNIRLSECGLQEGVSEWRLTGLGIVTVLFL